jgi:oligopeptide/dipeptide ABC transporter ATP-binding protein
MSLEIRGLNVDYHRPRLPPVRAVVEVDLDVRSGQVVGLVGESGCGKSTLARAAIGLVPRTSGTVLFDGMDVTPLGSGGRPQRLQRIQMVFQDPYASLNPRRKVGRQIADGLRAQVGDDRERQRRVASLLEQVGLNGAIAGRYPFEFSGGQRQRIAIARALAADPEIIIADEAVSSLDASVQAQILNLFKDLQAHHELAYLFISHDLGVVKYMSHLIAVMYLGEIVELAPAEAVYDEPLHPYTRALVSAVPSLRRPRSRIRLEGEPPNPTDPPPGCKFHPRCPLATKLCRVEHPRLRDVAPGRLAACHYAEEVPVRMGSDAA